MRALRHADLVRLARRAGALDVVVPDVPTRRGEPASAVADTSRAVASRPAGGLFTRPPSTVQNLVAEGLVSRLL